MATNCKHHVADIDDESLLLDDGNNFNNKCTKCIESNFLWTDVEVTQVHDENSDSAEDSPLLIEVLLEFAFRNKNR